MIEGARTGVVRVRTPQVAALTAELERHGAQVTATGPDTLNVAGVEAPIVGRAALAAQVELHELVADRADLEDVFLALTHGKAGIR